MEQSEKKVFNVKKFIVGFWLTFLFFILSIFLVFFGISEFEILGKLPTFEQLENPNSHLATEIYSSDRRLLGTVFKENRSICEQQELSPFLTKALVSTEDERYYKHSGIDGKSILRAIVGMGSSGGGSTITQQLAKMLFTENITKNFITRVGQKLNEWVIAVKLERQYTKEEIITMYFNQLDFVNNAVGIKSAANIYFTKSPLELKVEEAAMLVGMAKNPSLFNPLRRPERVLDRRNVVLNQMLKNDCLTEAQYDSLKLLPLGLKVNKASHREGIATYFREEVRSQLTKIFETLKKSDGSSYDIYRDGLKVYTTLNYDIQVHAENAVRSHLADELQPEFFKHWKNKSASQTKFAPFYFEGMSDEQKYEMVEKLVLKGIRTSDRYKRALELDEELSELSIKYNRLYNQITIYQDSKLSFQEKRQIYVQQLNHLSNDTLSEEASFKEKQFVTSAAEAAEDSVDKYESQISNLQSSYDKARNEYLKVWKPFDDKMQRVFKKPVEMSIFTWNGSKDTVMSPRDSVIHHKWYLRTGLMSIDPKTGFIKAWVGGIDYKFFQYDGIRGTRQVGSTFKPFVYACAIENGISPCENILNAPVTFPAGMYGLEQAWTPKNSALSDLDGESISLKMALANSINYVTAKIMKDFGPLAAIDVARRCGITTPIQAVPSICLGTSDVSLFEMVSAYAVFANKGIWIEPSFIFRIEDRNGSVIWTPNPKRREAMTEENAFKMIELLGGIAAYGPKVNGKVTMGTGVRLRSSNRPYGSIPMNIKIAGKTGTTQMQSDGWFMGITPDLVTGVWVGCEDRAAHFTSLRLGMGTNTALPIWGYFMNSVYKDEKLKISKDYFELPKSLRREDVDCSQKQTVVGAGNGLNFDD